MTVAYISKDMSRYKLPFYTVLHPGAGFDELRYRKKNSVRMSLLYFALLVLLAVAEQQFMGPQIEMVDPNAVNLMGALFLRLAVLFLFVLSNWAFCVLVDGKATFLDIWIITTYSLQPYIYCGFLRVLLSNVIIEDESAYLSFLLIVGGLWSFGMLMTAFMTFHEFEVGKALFSLLITMIGMFLIVFLVFLMYSLFQQVVSTILTVFNEISFRFRAS